MHPSTDMTIALKAATKVDNLLSMTVHTGAIAGTYYAVKDHLGTVHALTDGSGAVVESYRFDAWGNVLGVFDSSGSEISSRKSEIGNRYLWQGREYSWLTGFYYFRARWYDPRTGRWLSNDPIGISGGLNQYVFCGNDPVNNRDPAGLKSLLVVNDWWYHAHIVVPDGHGKWKDCGFTYRRGCPAFAPGLVDIDPIIFESALPENYYIELCTTPEEEQKILEFFDQLQKKPGFFMASTRNCANIMREALEESGFLPPNHFQYIFPVTTIP